MPTCPDCGEKVRAHSPNKVKKGGITRHKRCRTEPAIAFLKKKREEAKVGKPIPTPISKAPWHLPIYKKLRSMVDSSFFAKKLTGGKKVG